MIYVIQRESAVDGEVRYEIVEKDNMLRLLKSFGYSEEDIELMILRTDKGGQTVIQYPNDIEDLVDEDDPYQWDYSFYVPKGETELKQIFQIILQNNTH